MKSPIGSCEKDQCFVHGSVRVWGLYILGLGAKVGKLVLYCNVLLVIIISTKLTQKHLSM